MENVNTRRQIPFLFLNPDKVLKNSTPGNVAYIWQIEWVRIDEIQFEKTQIIF